MKTIFNNFKIFTFAILLWNCDNQFSQNELPLPPKEPDAFPALTERNRLLGVLSPERSCYDVLHYMIDIEFDIDKKYIKGFVDIRSIATKNFSVLQFDLARKMILNKVEYQDQILKTSRTKDAVFVEFPEVKGGENFTFRIYYEGRPLESKNPPWDGGFVWEEDKNGRPFISVVCEGDGASLWWPLKDHISDEPNEGAIMTFTVPSELFCVSNGRLTDVSSNNDKTKKSFTWSVNNPINNYNISVQIGHYESIQDTIHRSGVIDTLNYYVLDYHKEVATNHFKQSKKVIRFFEKYFSEFQWWDDGYKLVEVSYLGMEHQSAVTYGNNWSNWGGDRDWTNKYYGIVDGLLFHETAHEWWGNSVTAIDPAHMWIHEGMAVYSEAMFIEDQLGYNVMIDFLLDKRKSIRNRRPIVGPSNQNYWAFGDSYNKGAWVLHTLRNIINDDKKWFSILKDFSIENAKSHVSTEDFLNHVIRVTKKNYQLIFYQYFYNHRPPTLEYYQDGNKYYYRWSNVISGFAMPIDVDLNGVEKRLYPTESLQSLDISKHSVVYLRDWEFYIINLENPDIKTNDKESSL
jgi:aminopeptidase N